MRSDFSSNTKNITLLVTNFCETEIVMLCSIIFGHAEYDYELQSNAYAARSCHPEGHGGRYIFTILPTGDIREFSTSLVLENAQKV